MILYRHVHPQNVWEKQQAYHRQQQIDSPPCWGEILVIILRVEIGRDYTKVREADRHWRNDGAAD